MLRLDLTTLTFALLLAPLGCGSSEPGEEDSTSSEAGESSGESSGSNTNTETSSESSDTTGDGDGDTAGDGDGDTTGDGDGDTAGDGDGDGDGDTTGDGDGDGDGDVCSEIEADYNTQVATTNCIDTSDCHVLNGQCGVGLGGCYEVVNTSVGQEVLNELGELYSNGGCTGAVCDCPEPPGAACVDGDCVAIG